MFSRIVFTADILRPFPARDGWESATWKHVRWLHRMLGRPIEGCGFALSTLAWDDRASPELNDWIDPAELYERLGLPLSLQNWARLCRRRSAPDELVSWLEPVVRDALVIGYELPEILCDALRRLGQPYIDVILHPIRFMPDLVFAFRTNVESFHRVFERFRIPEESIWRQADLIRAKAAWMAAPEAMPPGTALVLGQVGNDRAMVAEDGRFVSLADHVEALHRLCTEHPLVLFKPHPYAVADDPSRAAVEKLPAIRTTTANFYHLLAQPEIELVVALNSSGLFEARYFDCATLALQPSLYDFESRGSPTADAAGCPVPLDGSWTRAQFWESVLRGSDAAGPCPASMPEAGLVRRSMNADWGYGFIERICA